MGNQDVKWRAYFKEAFPKSKYDRVKWRNLWIKALANMPAINEQATNLGLYGQQSALARCLSYHPSRGMHNAVFSGLRKGSRPFGERAKLLEQLAGPKGAELAQSILGSKTRYKIWPTSAVREGWVMP